MDDIENLHYAVHKACDEALAYKAKAAELEHFLVELAKRSDVNKEVVGLIQSELIKVHPHG